MSDCSSPIRMSFIFPLEFYDMLKSCSQDHGQDMTYIIMEAVNDWVAKKEGIGIKA